MIRADSDTFVCKPFSLDAGVYRFAIADAMFEIQKLIGPDPQQELTLALPAPGQVIVDILDNETGAHVDDFSLEWLPEAAQLPSRDKRWRWVKETASGRYEFRAPLGHIGLYARSFSGSEYSAGIASVDVVRGTNPIEIRLARDYLLTLTLVEGEARVPWRTAWKDLPTFESADGSAVQPASEFESGSGLYIFHFPAPEHYRLRPFTIPGYRETFPSDFEFHPVSPGRKHTSDVPLFRD
jgi:hypothetical protein